MDPKILTDVLQQGGVFAAGGIFTAFLFWLFFNRDHSKEIKEWMTPRMEALTKILSQLSSSHDRTVDLLERTTKNDEKLTVIIDKLKDESTVLHTAITLVDTKATFHNENLVRMIESMEKALEKR